ncbi:MAG: aminodeoxychorismate/anthranilate synthase component II [Cytophagales bacterium]
MLLIIDNYDSFTYNLLDYFEQLGQECQLIRNDLEKKDWPENPDAIVISPGPMDPLRAGNLMQMIDYYCEKVPILGICLGHQALALKFGAKLEHAIKPMHGKISRIFCEDDPIFENIPKNFNVVRYHSLIIKELPGSLKALAKTNEEELMAFRHTRLAIYGIQFHPEAALTEYGLQLLENCLHCFAQNAIN